MELLPTVTKYWHIISAIIGLIIFAVKLQVQNQDQEKRMTSLENDNKEIKLLQSKIETSLAQIQTDLEWLKRNWK